MSTQNAKPIFSMQTNSVKIDLNAKTSFITNITLRCSCLLNILLPYYQGVKLVRTQISPTHCMILHVTLIFFKWLSYMQKSWFTCKRTKKIFYIVTNNTLYLGCHSQQGYRAYFSGEWQEDSVSQGHHRWRELCSLVWWFIYMDANLHTVGN